MVMAENNRSFLSRFTHGLLRTRKQAQIQLSNNASSWPRTSRSRTECAREEDEEFEPLLETTVCESNYIFQRPSRQSTRERRTNSILAIPSRCHLPAPKRFTTFLSSIFLAILLIASTTQAAPLQNKHHKSLLKRQSIPDRFGNTGNVPGEAPQDESQPPQEPEPESVSPTITVTATATRTVAPSPTNTVAVSSSTIPPSSLLASISSTTPSLSTSTSESPTQLPPAPTSLDSTPTSPSPPPPPDANSSSPAEPLLRTTPMNPLSTATIAGIIAGSSALLLLLLGLTIVLYRRRKAREIEEIPIRRSKLGSRLAFRVFGSHYDERIARSRSGSRDTTGGGDGGGEAGGRGSGVRFTERRRSSGARSNEKQQGAMTLQVPTQTYGGTTPSKSSLNGPISPSVYSPRLTRISTMTFGSMGGGWLDKSVIGRPMPAFTGTPSQLLDVPKPLFAKADKGVEDKWVVEKSDISAPRPARPGSAEPLGRLSGMGYGLGMGHGK